MGDAGPRVLVVEDEESFVEALTVGLKREGFDVVVARDGVQALSVVGAAKPDLILLDIMLPGISGTDVLRELRRTSRTPVILVTAKDSELDTVVGLELGADDYVTKPYRMRELVARMRAVLRRAPAEAVATDEEELLESDGVRLDLARHELTVRGQAVGLPRKEFEVLELLMANVGRVLTREALLDQVWGADYVGDTKTLDVHIKRIRSKIDESEAPSRITTIRGVGYRFEGRRPTTGESA